MYEQSHHDYLRSGYLHHRHLSWAVNHCYRDNAITYKAQRDKNTRTDWRTRQLHPDAGAKNQRDVTALDASHTRS